FSISFLYSCSAAHSTLSLHDALPIFESRRRRTGQFAPPVFQASVRAPDDGGIDSGDRVREHRQSAAGKGRRRLAMFAHAIARIKDRKSTRLNSSHQIISYAVFCLKKK